MSLHPLFIKLYPNSKNGSVLINGMFRNELAAIDQLLNVSK